MIWVDRVVTDLVKRKKPLEWVDDMKTPSGRIHVGSLRGVVIHDLVYKALLENKVKAKFTYVFEDHDPMDAIPSYLEYAKWEKYAGMPLYKIPSPVKGFKSYAEYYAKEFQNVFESINCHPEIIWMSKVYAEGKMNGVVKEALDNADKIRKIYKRIAKTEKSKDWYPFQVVCENCKKIGTTHVYKWDGKLVYYRCQPKMVAWAVGCGHEGKMSPYDGRGKMPWRVEWPAKWKVIGITVEGGGKDHMSKGGSHDMASVISTEVFDYPVPYPLPYEFFIIGGKKMSSSKGVGISAAEVAKILPPDLFRFLMVRTPIERTLDFNPHGDTIPNLFDDYDRCMSAYYDKNEGKLPEGKQGEVLSDFARIIELSQVRSLPEKRVFLARFRTIVNLVKNKSEVLGFFEQQKGKSFTKEEKKLLNERVVYAEKYLAEYAPKEEVSKLNLNPKQKAFLKSLSTQLSKVKKPTRDSLQDVVFVVLKSDTYDVREMFQGFYQAVTGKDSGPKAADIILELGVKNVQKRIKESLT